jgi:hypothetical protein
MALTAGCAAKAWIRSSILFGAVAIVAWALGCSGSSGSSKPTPTATATPFAGINQTYVLAGGVRRLTLNGLTGSYRAVTFSGTNQLAVSLTQNRITIGGLSLPYMAVGNFFQGGGFMGFASGAVSTDPTKFPATYNTLAGANFAGQLAITAGATYTWCRASTFVTSGTCADGTTPQGGSIVLKSTGFTFGGLPGTYAVYHQGSASALFPVDNRGLALRALSETSVQPTGSFSQALIAATASNNLATLALLSDKITIAGVPNFSGSYSYSSSGRGAFSFASAYCRNGICPGIFNDVLGIVYLAQVGNAVFIRP